MLQKNSSLKTLGHNLSNNVSKDPKLLGHICFQSLLSLAAHWARLVTTSSYARFLKTSHHFLRLLITSQADHSVGHRTSPAASPSFSKVDVVPNDHWIDH